MCSPICSNYYFFTEELTNKPNRISQLLQAIWKHLVVGPSLYKFRRRLEAPRRLLWPSKHTEESFRRCQVESQHRDLSKRNHILIYSLEFLFTVPGVIQTEGRGGRGREGQAAMNPVEKSPKPCRNSLRTPWKISEPCKKQKMCYSGGNRMIFEFFSTYGSGSNKSITNKCNFDLIHGPSICLFCIPFLS